MPLAVVTEVADIPLWTPRVALSVESNAGVFFIFHLWFELSTEL